MHLKNPQITDLSFPPQMDSQAVTLIIKVTLLPQFINFHHLITLHLIITLPIPILHPLIPTPIITTPHLPHLPRLILIILNIPITITIKPVH
jgi:hypothetical protein